MKNVTEYIKARRSVRTYDDVPLSEEAKADLMNYAAGITNPYGVPVEFKLMSAKENGLNCPVVVGTDLYVGAKVKRVPDANIAFGYSFEKFVIYAQSRGVGTVWLGGTFNRPAYEAAMELASDEMMPCASALGYPAKKMSMKEGIMRKAVKADERKAFCEVFFDGMPDVPLTMEKAGAFAEALEMVRLAPSAVNKQPWRVIVKDNAAHFYIKRSKGFTNSDGRDMQITDLGIALCHFALATEAGGINVSFVRSDPDLTAGTELEYVATYKMI